MDIPGYKIVREIGHGGMSTVYLAVQESLGRDIALKVMAPALAADRSFSERFLKEGRTVARLAHRHIVAVYDIGVAEHHHYISMEYVGGGDLRQRIQEGLTPKQSLEIARQVAEALKYANGKGITHRDVKPENILFREDGSVVLSDFGIAKAAGSGTKMTATGMAVGTPHYMSPEQARGTRVDGRSDLYSLGIVLYEMLTGEVPYDAGDSLAIGMKHVNDPLPTLPSRFRRLQYLLNGLLAKHPKDRYADGGELIHAIDNPPADIDSPKAETVLIQSSIEPTGPGRPGGTKSAWKWGVGGAGSAWKWGVGGAVLAVALIGGVYVLQKPKALVPAGGGSQMVARSKEQAPARRPAVVERTAKPLEESRPITRSAGSRPGGGTPAQRDKEKPTTPAAASDDSVAPSPVAETPAKSAGDKPKAPAGDAGVIAKPERAAPAGKPDDVDPTAKPPTGAEQVVQQGTETSGRIVTLPPDAATPAKSVEKKPVSAADDTTEAVTSLKTLETPAEPVGDRPATDTVVAKARPVAPPPDTGTAARPDRKKPKKSDDATEKAKKRQIKQKKIERLLVLAEQALQAGRLVKPEGDNALAHYRAVLALQPNHRGAQKGVSGIANRLIEMATEAAAAGNIDAATAYLSHAAKIQPESGALKLARQLLEEKSGQKRPAGDATALTAEGEKVATDQTFRDRLSGGDPGPEMVVIPAGSFQMGNPRAVMQLGEKPVHTVTFAQPFAVSRFELTFDDYDRYLAATGQQKNNAFGFGRGRRPAINVTWDEAVAYTQWLSKETGKRYRLLTEAEWEYVARGGTVTKYWWGKRMGSNNTVCQTCGSDWDDEGTAPAGSFRPNPFGVYDVIGNASEWVQDCWHGSYKGAPTDGSAWLAEDCEERVVRGGNYRLLATAVRVTQRLRFLQGTRLPYIGFRVARDL